MIVLDTNVVSELMRPAPEPDVVNWVDGLDVSDILLTAVTAGLQPAHRTAESCPENPRQACIA
jgi:hypothetical protein